MTRERKDEIWDKMTHYDGSNYAFCIEQLDIQEASMQKEIDRLKEENEQKERTLNFLRSEISKIRHFVFESKEIGLPNQNIFEAINDKINKDNAEIESLKGKLKHAEDQLDNVLIRPNFKGA